ncbi:MAG TPA: hypothetical protein VHV10_10820 [Ktedonobacteraceae bacterium]|nr:hypothetical protein [Ktedonobacteraceae bacterium]
MKPNQFDRAAKHKARDHVVADLQRLLAACACTECQDAKGWLESSEALHMSMSMSQDADFERRANAESITTILDRLQATGFLNSQQRQMAAAQLAVRPMFGNIKA